MSNYTQAEILSSLDRMADEHEFPIPDNVHFIYGDMRLVAFRSDDEWLIVFDEAAYDHGSGEFFNAVFAAGNRLKKQGFLGSLWFGRYRVRSSIDPKEALRSIR